MEVDDLDLYQRLSVRLGREVSSPLSQFRLEGFVQRAENIIVQCFAGMINGRLDI
jgi:hypothetical protein